MFVNTEDIKANVVQKQKPDPDTIVRKGDTVILSVSSGPAQLQMPDLTGKTSEEAMNLIKTMGMVPSLKPVLSDNAVDTVVSQSPAEGEKVTKETIVTLDISGGKTAVPLLKNLTLQEAEEKLAQNQPISDSVNTL